MDAFSVSFTEPVVSQVNVFNVGFRFSDAEVGATYFFNRHVFLSASYNYEKLKSNLEFDQISANKFWLVLSLER